MNILTTPAELIDAGLVPAAAHADLARVAALYSIGLSDHLRGLIDPADPADPIARQFIPDIRELQVAPNELADPIADAAFSPCEGLVHRYRDRALLKLLTVCPVYCRFCFRRETVGASKGGLLSPEAFATALDYLRGHEEIWEVILTGGDPLALSARRLAEALEALAALKNIKIMRIHSRLPTAAPELITPALTAALGAARLHAKQLICVVHVNHPRELSDAARAAFAALANAGVMLLSQSVLLAGINDDPRVLADLMRGLLAMGVKPYYLHHCDLARGTRHFRVSLSRGREIYRLLSQDLSGVARPAYVIDIPGGYGKIPADGDGVAQVGRSAWRLRDRAGVWRDYRECEQESG